MLSAEILEQVDEAKLVFVVILVIVQIEIDIVFLIVFDEAFFLELQLEIRNPLRNLVENFLFFGILREQYRKRNFSIFRMLNRNGTDLKTLLTGNLLYQ